MDYKLDAMEHDKANMKKIIFDPDLDERMQEGYYFATGRCSNCRQANVGVSNEITVMIPEGQLIPKEKYECPNCKCKTLEIM